MVSLSSRATDSSSSRSKRPDGEQGKDAVASKISQLRKQIQASRLVSIKEKLEKNAEELKIQTQKLFAMASKSSSQQPETDNVLLTRMATPLCKLGGPEWGEKESVNNHEEVMSPATVVFGGNGGGKSFVRLVKLPFVEKIPPYTTWMFLDRNQRMAEDQSVVGRRQIYYDNQYGSEALVCSDSEEEVAEPEEEKHEFSKAEDEILWTVLQDHGLNQQVLGILCQHIEATASDIEERYEALLEKNVEKHDKSAEDSGEVESEGNPLLNKTLSAALDSFDNLFCRRCLNFDCRLHGCSQNLIIPSEKLSFGVELEENRTPCGDHCFLKKREHVPDMCPKKTVTSLPTEKPGMASSPESEDSHPSDDSKNLAASDETSMGANRQLAASMEANETGMSSEVSMKSIGKRKILDHERMGKTKAKLVAEKCMYTADKKQKKLPAIDLASITDTKCEEVESLIVDRLQKQTLNEFTEDDLGTDDCPGSSSNAAGDAAKTVIEAPLGKTLFGSSHGQSAYGWNIMERDLYLKGLEIFGKNSCLIARNLLPGMKTCMEVAKYMLDDTAAVPSRPVLTDSCLADSAKADHDPMEDDIAPRTRIWRRRGKTRKLKYTWKSAGHPSIRKRIADGKQQSCRQYTPCGCLQMCAKDCPCMHNGTCCEKYCGCSKSCKNRFRGCHCAKSQCRSRQCPCFAAGRECDPDVCRNCWVSCGDGSLGEPPARGDGYQCGNMNLLLKQQQRIFLGRSDVAGWGAFIKNPVNKNDYLGEYTGELISHKEADKRGKIYDRANSSFLFDLNDQYVLDAYRKGDKLKFANHSSNPNCYAKVMLVAGDHRVGIFAKEHIEASEELFYDYRYGPDQAPLWARKPEGSKRDESSVPRSRAQKAA